MQWTKTIIRLDVNGSEEHDYYYSVTPKYVWNCLDAGAPIVCEAVHNQKMKHWVIGCTKFGIPDFMLKKADYHEPTYQEKVTILKDLGLWKEVALEVFPPQDEIVDVEEVYHIWEFQYPYSFMVNIFPIRTCPNLSKIYDQYEYEIVENNGNQYFYIKSKDGHELCWKEKQNLKDRMIGKRRTAVEIIWSEMEEANYTCLVCLKSNEYLDFGLNQPAW